MRLEKGIECFIFWKQLSRNINVLLRRWVPEFVNKPRKHFSLWERKGKIMYTNLTLVDWRSKSSKPKNHKATKLKLKNSMSMKNLNNWKNEQWKRIFYNYFYYYYFRTMKANHRGIKSSSLNLKAAETMMYVQSMRGSICLFASNHTYPMPRGFIHVAL